jgi:hypothetical protein
MGYQGRRRGRGGKESPSGAQMTVSLADIATADTVWRASCTFSFCNSIRVDTCPTTQANDKMLLRTEKTYAHSNFPHMDIWLQAFATLVLLVPLRHGGHPVSNQGQQRRHKAGGGGSQHHSARIVSYWWQRSGAAKNNKHILLGYFSLLPLYVSRRRGGGRGVPCSTSILWNKQTRGCRALNK